MILAQQHDKTVKEVFYGKALTAVGIPYQEHEHWLEAGTFPEDNKWFIFLSVRVLSGGLLLEKVLPILKNLAVPFTVLKHNYALNKANGYGFGLDSVGKFLVAAVQTDEVAVKLVQLLQPISEQFGGPEVRGAIRVGKIIYVSGARPVGLKDVPFHIPKQYRVPKRKRIISRYYVPVQLLRSLPKGDTTKGINLRRFKLSWCLIKQGKSHASDDFFGRDMISRLDWQHQVLSDLADLNFVPGVIDLFRDEHAAYLVLDYIEGVTLREKVQQLTQGQTWKDLNSTAKTTILTWFLNAVGVVALIHERGYIHRDVTDENFILTPKNELSLIDFELSWSMKRQHPNPPFGLGTFGYMSPQQHAFNTPTKRDDIYSLGAILFFLLTGLHPDAFLKDNTNEAYNNLEEMIQNTTLSSLVVKCLDTAPDQRPKISEIKAILLGQLDELHNL